MFVKKAANGEYYLCASKGKPKKGRYKVWRNTFIIKYKGLIGVLPHTAREIYFPKELAGKRIRFKIEIVEDDKNGFR